MTVALARSKGFKIDEELRRRNAAATLEAWSRYGESIIEGTGRPNMVLTASYTLVGLAADAQPPDPTTTAMVRFLAANQKPDGSWHSRANRPPMEYSDVTATALCLRALQLYSPKGWAEQTARQVARARAWLAALQPESTEESAFQLLGLRWADADEALIKEALKKLASRQRPDGGWAQLPTLESNAYGTGEALVALNQGGAMSPSDPVYKRGVEFLIKAQHPDGSWFVQTRSFPIQAYFESGFPYGKSQFISAAATSWATMALTLAIE
jgi:squalene cyclase